jgi:hypothetical protein
MIRRGFWLLAGAALGVTGYRKASRLARSITGAGPPGALTAGGPRAGSVRARQPRRTHTARSAGDWARSAASFVRDVREGMTDYRDLQDGRPGRRFPGAGPADSRVSPGSRSLKSLSDWTESGRSQQGHSEF